METTHIAAHICPDCAAPNENLAGLVSRLEEENRVLRQLDGALRRNRALFEALLKNSADGITLTGANRRVLRVVRGLMGFAPGELNGVLFESLVIPEDRHIVIGGYRLLLDSRCQRTGFEVRAFRADGSLAHLSFTLTDMLDDPDVQAIVCNYSDVTRWKREELMEAEFAAIVRSADGSIFSKDTEGRILTWNDGARRMFGYEEDEMVGRHVRILIPEDLRAEEEKSRQLVVETGDATKLHTIRVAKDGTRIPVVIELAPVLDAYGRTRGMLHLSRRATAQSPPR